MGRYVITGAAGFIGGALTKKLVKAGHEVHAMDLPEKIATKQTNLEGSVVYGCTVIDPDSFRSLKGHFDGAFHLAAQTSARISEENPERDIDTNVKGCFNFCNWARRVKPDRCVFTSSMAVYGVSGDNISEDTKVNPVSVYGVTKCSGEHFMSILSSDGIPTTIYRLFNVYGPGQDFYNMKQGMLSIFLTQALTQPEIKVTGSLDRYRDFVYIDDVVNALLLSYKTKTGEVLNVGNGEPVFVKGLIEQIIELVSPFRSNISVHQIESHRGDVWGNYANVDRLHSYGWSSTVTLKEGLKSTITNAMEVLKCR